MKTGLFRILKETIFGVVCVVSIVIVLGALYLLGADCYKLKHLDGRNLSQITKNQLEEKSKSHHIPDMPGGFSLKDVGSNNANIYVFGASSVVMSDNGKTFSYYLENKLNDLGYSVTVSLEGVPGSDSFFVRNRIEDVLSNAAKKPDLLIIYSGHNDYNYVYHRNGRLPIYLKGIEKSAKISYFLTAQKYRESFADNEQDNFNYFLRTYAPRIINLLQMTRLTTVRSEEFEGINNLVREYFKKNIDDSIRLAHSMGIPVILCTPIGNLHAEPYGNYGKVTEVYRRGLRASEYNNRILLLTKAKDEEIFTYDTRAKSPLLDDIRLMSRQGGYVLDLEKILIEKHFSFSYDDFMDYFHMKDKTHREIGYLLVDLIEKNHLLTKDYVLDGSERGMVRDLSER